MAIQDLKMITDVGRIFSASANENITAGMFVKAVANNNVVGAAGTSTYATGDILVMKMDAAADDESVVGMALHTATSGNVVSVATEGVFILPTQAAVTAGFSISPSNVADDFCNSVILTADTEEEFKIGKALTSSSASGNYIVALVRI